MDLGVCPNLQVYLLVGLSGVSGRLSDVRRGGDGDLVVDCLMQKA